MFWNEIKKAKFLKVILAIQVLLFNLKAQNLVTNGHFEIYTACPNAPNQLSNAVGWVSVKGTPDYCNACSSNWSTTVPDNGYTGYQPDCCGGGGYAGVFTTQGQNDDREFMQTKLLDTLQIGHKYVASMNVSCADHMNYAISTIGIYLTDTTFVLPSSAPSFTPTPQVRGNVLLSDTMNWVVVQDTFVAVSRIAYLTIGNFNLDSTSDTARIQDNPSYFYSSYYYIDNVSVYDVATLEINDQKGKKAELKICPNPTNDYFEIVCSLEFSGYNLEDILGNILMTRELNNRKEKIDVSELPNGIYFLNIKTPESVLSKKVVVQH